MNLRHPGVLPLQASRSCLIQASYIHGRRAAPTGGTTGRRGLLVAPIFMRRRCMGPAMASRRESREERKGEKERTDAMWGMWRNVCVGPRLPPQ